MLRFHIHAAFFAFLLRLGSSTARFHCGAVHCSNQFRQSLSSTYIAGDHHHQICKNCWRLCAFILQFSPMIPLTLFKPARPIFGRNNGSHRRLDEDNFTLT
ncbi:hypothetical protein BDZ89DRAFT_832018 [Hymenopellis radicata]|nr:hypothetical protein BDZ89DRAFT_832018 [Hymenopellis radicata]